MLTQHLGQHEAHGQDESHGQHGPRAAARQAAPWHEPDSADDTRCAPISTDCSHLKGAATCKLGASVFEPDDLSNCLSCNAGYAFKDGNFMDCTGYCVKDSSAAPPPARKGEHPARRAARSDASTGLGANVEPAAPHGRGAQAGAKRRSPYGAHGGCVTVHEASRHYCVTTNVRGKCAHYTDDCSHIPGCTKCKKGAGVFWPGDMTNCLECTNEYSFKEGGFNDCTGTCTRMTKNMHRSTPHTTLPSHAWVYSPQTVDIYRKPPAFLAAPAALRRLENNGVDAKPHAGLEGRGKNDDDELALTTKGKSADTAGHLPCRELDLEFQPSSRSSKAPGGAEPPLLVMMTSVGKIQSNSINKQMLQQAAGVTWRALEPEVLTVVAIDTEDVTSPGNLPRVICPSNKAGTPYVSGLFAHAAAKAAEVGSRFAGFTNGDIAYDQTLIDVMTSIAAGIDSKRLKKRILVVGKRLNIDGAVEDAVNINLLARDGGRANRHLLSNLLDRISRKPKNTWMTTLAEDFFFFTPGTFDWENIPNFVIGRVGWDSFLTQWAHDQEDIDVIDATPLLHAAHMTGSDGNAAGWNTKRPDKSFNYCALFDTCEQAGGPWEAFCGSCFRCKLGGTKQAEWHLEVNTNSDASTNHNVARQGGRTKEQEAQTYTHALDQTKRMMRHFGIPTNKAPDLLETVAEQNSDCYTRGNCCSIADAPALEYELGFRWQVRGEWPLDGTYKPKARAKP